jgi:hypothetical protein
LGVRLEALAHVGEIPNNDLSVIRVTLNLFGVAHSNSFAISFKRPNVSPLDYEYLRKLLKITPVSTCPPRSNI